MNEEKISVIIPAYNEEKYIEQTIHSIQKWSLNPEIIIVDDGSTDQTPQILKQFCSDPSVKTVILPKNKGKGYAMMKGIEHAEGEIYVFLDADLKESASQAFHLLKPLFDDTADMTIAILPPSKQKGGFGLVKNIAKFGIYKLTGFQHTAPLSGQRAIRKAVMDQIKEFNQGFGIEVGLTIDVLRQGFRIREVEIPLTHRETGRDMEGFLHRGKEFIDVSKALIRKWKQSI